ncbi:MAG: malto-oligosyltrehalose trehalohydrolase [Acidimicrobiales bacterium]
MRVWAPGATRLEVVLDAGSRPLVRMDGGWWVDTEAMEPGTRYRVSVDGGEALADPRSGWQPDGVDGPSAVVDHTAFAWSDRAWTGPVPLASAVFYEIHVGTFSAEGTFDGVSAHLAELKELGVTHLELMPVAEFPGERGWGYDGVLLYAPHHAYGGPDGLKRLVDACHGAGLAVVLDVVYNHLGPDGNHLAEFGPYFTSRYATPWGDAVNLDGAGSDGVRRFFVDNALMWLRDYHVDALRLDAVHALLDTSATHLLEQLAVEVAALSGHLARGLQLVAESDLNDPRAVARREVGGYGMDGQWSDDFHHALHAVVTGEREGYYADFGSLSQLATALRRAWVYAGEYSPHRGRVHGRPPVGIPGWRFLGYLQNHDQIGNRAMGDRVAAAVPADRLFAAAALVACAPFTPMLFMGEEWGTRTPFPYFVDHTDPGLAAAVREGRRREFAAFGWAPESIPDPQDPDTAAAAVLDRSEIGRSPHRDLREWWRALLALRRRCPELTDGRLGSVDVAIDEAAGWLVLRRGAIAVGVNFGGAATEVPVGAGRIVLARRSGEGAEADTRPRTASRVHLEPDGVVIVEGTTGGPASAASAAATPS